MIAMKSEKSASYRAVACRCTNVEFLFVICIIGTTKNEVDGGEKDGRWRWLWRWRRRRWAVFGCEATAALWRGTTGPIDTAASGGCRGGENEREQGWARRVVACMVAGKTVGRWGCRGDMTEERRCESERKTRELWDSAEVAAAGRIAGVAHITPAPLTPLLSRMAPRSPAFSLRGSVAVVGLSECASNTLRRIGLRKSVVPQCYRACRFIPCPHCCWFYRHSKKKNEERKTSEVGEGVVREKHRSKARRVPVFSRRKSRDLRRIIDVSSHCWRYLLDRFSSCHNLEYRDVTSHQEVLYQQVL